MLLLPGQAGVVRKPDLEQERRDGEDRVVEGFVERIPLHFEFDGLVLVIDAHGDIDEFASVDKGLVDHRSSALVGDRYVAYEVEVSRDVLARRPPVPPLGALGFIRRGESGFLNFSGVEHLDVSACSPYVLPMRTLLAHRLRLDLTSEQRVLFARCAGVVRLVKGLAVEQRSTFSRPGRSIGRMAQCAELKDLRAEWDWIREIPQDFVNQALTDVEDAFRRFFKGEADYPRKPRKWSGDSFRFPARHDRNPDMLAGGFLKIPKIGRVRIRMHRPVQGEIRSVSISREGRHWYASILVQVDKKRPTFTPIRRTGIDVGVDQPLTEDDGTVHSIHGLTPGEEKRKLRLLQALTRRKKGSKNRGKTKAALCELEARGARRRKHLTHVATSDIVERSGLVAVEGLNVKGMTASARGTVENPGANVAAKSAVNRALLNVNPGEVRRQLAYKAEWANRTFVRVDPAYTSQRCSACMRHPLDAAETMEIPHGRISRSRFRCPLCEHEENADSNAAKVIRKLGILQASTDEKATARPQRTKAEAKAAREARKAERSARKAEKEAARKERKAAKDAEREKRAVARAPAARERAEKEKARKGRAPSKAPAGEAPVAACGDVGVGPSVKQEKDAGPNSDRDRSRATGPLSIAA
jgi:putative transposase